MVKRLVSISLVVILCTCLIFVPGSTVRAEDTYYYVSTSGNDSNQGTISSPFRTIQKAASVMTAGDTCYIREGTYRETVVPLNDGAEGSLITYQAYNR